MEGDERVVEVSATGLAQPANHRIGTSADELFTIRALRPGETRVRFLQRRPWEPDDTPAVSERIVDVRVS